MRFPVCLIVSPFRRPGCCRKNYSRFRFSLQEGKRSRAALDRFRAHFLARAGIMEAMKGGVGMRRARIWIGLALGALSLLLLWESRNARPEEASGRMMNVAVPAWRAASSRPTEIPTVHFPAPRRTPAPTAAPAPEPPATEPPAPAGRRKSSRSGPAPGSRRRRAAGRAAGEGQAALFSWNS